MGAPGGGSYYHQLHHAYFECNYGDSAGIPFDYIFGTFEDGSSKVKAAGVKLLKDGMAKGTEPLLARDRPISMDEIAKHNMPDDCWIVIHGIVLDITRFLSDHPGGQRVLLEKAGKDATKVFDALHNRRGGMALVEQHAPDAPIGRLVDDQVAVSAVAQ